MVTALLLQLFQSCSSQKAIVEAAQEYSNAYELLRKGGDVGGWGASQAPVAGQGESDEKKKKKSRKSTSGDGVDAGVDAQERARQQRKEQEDQMVEKVVWLASTRCLDISSLHGFSSWQLAKLELKQPQNAYCMRWNSLPKRA